MKNDEGATFTELPGVAVGSLFGRNDDFAGIAVEKTAVTVGVTVNSNAVAKRSPGDPAELRGDVTGSPVVPDADAVVVIAVDLNVLREGFVLPVGTAISVVVPGDCDENADAENGEAEESQAHLPGGVEDGFKGCVHDYIFYILWLFVF